MRVCPSIAWPFACLVCARPPASSGGKGGREGGTLFTLITATHAQIYCIESECEPQHNMSNGTAASTHLHLSCAWYESTLTSWPFC